MSEVLDRILIVDDEPSIREVLSRWLKKEGYECRMAGNVEEAGKALEEECFSLILLDLMMPEQSGEVLLHRVREHHPDIAVIMATAIDDRNTALDLLRKGAFGYVIKPLDQRDIMVNVASALGRREAMLRARDYQRRLEEEVRARTTEIRSREEEIVLRLAWVAESHDPDTGVHLQRIGLYSAALAQALGWPPDKVDDIRIAATMHDIGKIGIPQGILLKPGKLTTHEFEVVKKHAEIGACILSDSHVPLLQMAREIALGHHEKWDGSGYPQGQAGEKIPESARVVAIVDVYDALVEDRVYSSALPQEKALAIMKEGRDQHFDPRIFDSFMRLLPELQRLREQVAQSSGQLPFTEESDSGLGPLFSPHSCSLAESAWAPVQPA